MGGSPFPRPLFPADDWLGDSGLSLFGSACPQRGYFLAVMQAVYIHTAEASSGPAGWVTGWGSMSDLEMEY